MKNLSPFFRLIAIENCLKTGNWFSWKELGEACRVYLDNEKPPNERTTRYDIELLETKFNAPIEYIEGKVKYGDTNYSFLRLGMTEYHASILKELLLLVEQFSFLPHTDKLNEVLFTLEENAGLKAGDNSPIIQFDNPIGVTGVNYLKTLFEVIRNRKVIAFRYQPFKKDSENYVTVHPYFLKEYNHRWFLMGRNNETGHKEKFGLERIIGDIEHVDLEFKPTSLNYQTYFKDIVGVSKAPRVFKKKIVLAFSKARGKYVLTKPLHHSQKLVNDPNRPNNTVISIEVFPNWELTQLLLGFGKDMEVLKPKNLRDEIIENALLILENHKRMQF